MSTESRIRQLSQNSAMTVWPETGEVIPITEFYRRQQEQGPAFNVEREWAPGWAGDPNALVGEDQIPAWLRYEHASGIRPAAVPLDQILPPPGAAAAARQRAAAAGQRPRARQQGAPPAAAPAPAATPAPPMSLSRPRTERTDGAPAAPIPAHADRIEALALSLIEEDAQTGAGVYTDMGEMGMEMAREHAARLLNQLANPSAEPRNPPPPGSAGQLPPRSPDEAALEQEQALAGDVTRGYRSGRRDWQAEGDLQFARENGLGGQGEDETDLEVRRRIQRQRGFVQTQRGDVPVGSPITPADIDSVRGFQEWADETPGSDRQAQYNPSGYAEWKARRDEDRRRANAEDAKRYGRGPDSAATDDQIANRAERASSEDRIRWNQREAIYRRLASDAGMTVSEVRAIVEENIGAVNPGDAPPTSAQWANATREVRDIGYERKKRARDQQVATRRERLDRQNRMAGGQATGGPGGTRAMTDQAYVPLDRADELIARLGGQGLTDWQRAAMFAQLDPDSQGNPTPLGVDAVGAANAMRMMNAEALAGSLPPAQRAQEAAAARAESELPVHVRAENERDQNNGVLPANSAAGQDVLKGIATTFIGPHYMTEREYNNAVEAAVAEGIPRADAEAYFRRYGSNTNFGSALGEPAAAPATAPSAASSQPDARDLPPGIVTP